MGSVRMWVCAVLGVGLLGMAVYTPIAADVGDCNGSYMDDGLCVNQYDCGPSGCVSISPSKTCPSGDVCPYFQADPGGIYKYGGCGSWHQKTCKMCAQFVCASGAFYTQQVYDQNYNLTCVNQKCTGTMQQSNKCDLTP